jgi:hypothetical protein
MCCEQALINPILIVYFDIPNIVSVPRVLIHVETKIQQEM